MSEVSGLTVELITRPEAIPLSPDQWNALVAANQTNTIFQTWEWFDAWWRTFGAHSRRLFLLVVRRESRIIGFAALARRRSAFGWRRLEFAGTGNADYQDFVLPTDKEEAIAAICAFLRANWWRWDRLALGNIPAHSATLAMLASASAGEGLHFVDEARVACPTLMLQEDQQRVRRVIDKYSVRRPQNWFRKRGDVRFRHVTSDEEIERLLPKFFDQHRRRWRAVGKASLFTQARQVRFYASLARALRARGWLQFSVVEFNGAPIAFHFGFDYAGCLTWYKPAFEMRYAAHSPGLLLTRHLIEDGLNRSRREFDFTCGDESFKERFASRHRYNASVGIYHSAPLYWLAFTVHKLRRVAGDGARRIRAWKVGGAAAQRPPLVVETDSGIA